MSPYLSSYFGTPTAKIIILEAHKHNQKVLIDKCIHAGCPVTLYADYLTDELVTYSKLSYVQLRIGKMQCDIVDDGGTIVVDSHLTVIAQQTLYLDYMVGR